jgi:hypothetical protein
VSNADDQIPPDQRAAAREAEMIAAERALALGDFKTARSHLSDAQRLGAPKGDVQVLRQAINRSEKGMPNKIRKSFWVGLLISSMGYIILSFRLPVTWSIPVWAVLAFGLIPLISGFLTGAAQGIGTKPRDRFRAASWSTSTPMFFYTLISLIVLRTRIASGPDAGQLLLLVVLLCLFYGACAGVVAGLAARFLSSLVTHAPKRRHA